MADLVGALLPVVQVRMPPETGSLTEQAEQLGELELDRWMGTSRATIKMGDYWSVHIRVCGSGETSDAAISNALTKARAVLTKLGGMS